MFGAIAASWSSLDQASKAWVESSFALVVRRRAGRLAGRADAGHRRPRAHRPVRERRRHLRPAGRSAPLLGIASLGVIAVIVWVQARQGVHSLLLTVALGLLLGGAVGNLLDRLRFGHVVDWVDTGIGDARFYTFNVADSAISIAVAAAARSSGCWGRGWRASDGRAEAATRRRVDGQLPNGGHP